MPKNKRFGMVFPEYYQKVLKEMASELDISISAFIRLLIREAATKRGLWPPPKEEQSKPERG